MVVVIGEKPVRGLPALSVAMMSAKDGRTLVDPGRKGSLVRDTPLYFGKQKYNRC